MEVLVPAVFVLPILSAFYILKVVIKKNSNNGVYSGSVRLLRILLVFLFLTIIASTVIYFFGFHATSTFEKVLRFVLLPPMLLFGLWGICMSLFSSGSKIVSFVNSRDIYDHPARFK